MEQVGHLIQQFKYSEIWFSRNAGTNTAALAFGGINGTSVKYRNLEWNKLDRSK
jgi:hypothetical protein